MTHLILLSSFGTKFGKRSYPTSVSLLIGPHFLLFLVLLLIDAGNNSIAERINFVLGHNLSIKSSKTKNIKQLCKLKVSTLFYRLVVFHLPVSSEDNPFHLACSSYGYGPKESSKYNTLVLYCTTSALGTSISSSLSLFHFLTKHSLFLKLWKNPHRGAVFPYLSVAL